MPTGPARLRTPDGKMNGLGERVEFQRRKQRLTQDELCGRIAFHSKGEWNPSRLDIVRVEQGRRLVTDLEVKMLAAALECSACWMLLGDDMLL